MPALVAWRVVQGAGGGGLMIGAQAVLGEVVSPRERGRYLGLLGAVYVLAAVGGPLLGGFVVDHLSWRWIFALYPPLGLVALIVVVRTLRLPAPQARPPIDCSARCCLAHRGGGGPAQPVSPGTPSTSPLVAPARPVAGRRRHLGWLLTARRAADPVLPLRLFRTRSSPSRPPSASSSASPCSARSATCRHILQVARGASATQAGLVITA